MLKKYIFLLYIFVFMFCFSSAFAANNVVISPQSVTVNGVEKNFEVYNIDGNNFFKLRDIAFVLNGTASQFSVEYNVEKKLIETFTSKEYKSVGGEMVVGEDKSATAILSSQKLLINDVSKDLTAYNIGGNNFFKLRELGAELDFGVDYNQKKNQVVIESKEEVKIANITNVVAKIFKDIPYIEVTTDEAIHTCNAFHLSEPDRIILDISNSNLKIENKEINVQYGILSKIRMGYQGDNVNRFVLDVTESSDYKIIQSIDKKTTYLVLSHDLVLSDLVQTDDDNRLAFNGDSITMSPTNSGESIVMPNEKESGESVIIPEENSGESYEQSSGDSGEEIITDEMLDARIKIKNVKYSASTNKIKITGSGKVEYESFILTDPNRIVVDLKNAVLEVDGPTTITPNNKNITSIRFSQNDTFVVRVVIDVKLEGDYKVTTNKGNLEIVVDEVVPGKLEYENFESYATLTLYNVKKRGFTKSESSKHNTYTLKFDDTDFAPKKETMKIVDEFIEEIKITSSKIVISGNGNTTFSLTQDGDNVVVKMYVKEVENKDGDFVVLLDAGHGGSDPGACNGDDYEKVYNLAIMLKLKELLEDTEGITVHASRTTDEYIGRDGRLEFATSYENADLYVSVHNNSSSNKNYDGTLVMYHNGDYEKDYGITSKELAEIVLKELVNDLETRSWGVRDPLDQVWVLYYSELPSIMCEVSFISNDAELARLKTEEFQETAAQAIYNGIMIAKEKMGK